MRHRVVVVLLGLSGLLLGAVSAHADSRPPTVVAPVRLTLSAAPASGTSVGIANITTLTGAGGVGLAADYLATTPDVGAVVDVVGIVGPGVATVSFTPGRVASGTVTTVTLAGTLDCDNDRWWTATDAEYRVRVVGIDRLKHSRIAVVPLAPPDAASWRQAVQRACLTSVLGRAVLDRWLVMADPRQHAVTLSVRVHNPASRSLFLQLAFPGRPSGAGAAVVEVPAHSSRTVATTWQAGLCRWVPTALLPTSPSPSGTTVLLLRVGVGRFTPPGLIGEDPFRTAVAVPPQAQGLSTQIGRACRLAA